MMKLAIVGMLGLVAGCSAGKTDTTITKDTVSVSSGQGGSGGANEGGSSQDGGADAEGGAGGGEMGVAPIVVLADCDVEAGAWLWAIGSFPGKTAEELAHVIGFVTHDSDPSFAPPGFRRVKFDLMVINDGEVGGQCSVPGLQATFILPAL